MLARLGRRSDPNREPPIPSDNPTIRSSTVQPFSNLDIHVDAFVQLNRTMSRFSHGNNVSLFPKAPRNQQLLHRNSHHASPFIVFSPAVTPHILQGDWITRLDRRSPWSVGEWASGLQMRHNIDGICRLVTAPHHQKQQSVTFVFFLLTPSCPILCQPFSIWIQPHCRDLTLPMLASVSAIAPEARELSVSLLPREDIFRRRRGTPPPTDVAW